MFTKIGFLQGWANRTNNYEILRYEGSVKMFQFSGEMCVISIINAICKPIMDVLPGPSSPKSYYDVSLIEIVINQI